MKTPAWIYLFILIFKLCLLLIGCSGDNNKPDFSYVEKYTGDWDFKVYLDNRWLDTSYIYSYQGKIIKKENNKLTLIYAENTSTTIRIKEDGEILANAEENKSGKFVGENMVHLRMQSGTNAGIWLYTEDISGQKEDGNPTLDLSPVATTYIQMPILSLAPQQLTVKL
jgi:hypothetical protein